MLKTINVGLLGLGTVGAGTLSVLTRNREEMQRRTNCMIRVSHAVARNPNKPHLDTTGITLSKDPFVVVNHPEVDIVVELMGGYEPARELVMRAIANGKHVITANKALIAVHGNEIFEAAQKKGVMVAYEAAVAGGIPIIKVLREGLSANRIEWIAGIINGTGNFILSEMRDKGRDFDAVLKEAQALGYAEADPSFDIEGTDAAHKLTILASIAYGIPMQFDKVYTEGISRITQQDIAYAEELGYRIKHLGISKRTAAGIELRVHPALIPERSLIANVNGVMNSVMVMGDAVGPTLFYGAGAGAEPTASSVIADIINVARTIGCPPETYIPNTGFHLHELVDIPIIPVCEIESAYYLRMQALDKPGVMAKITHIFGDADISIEAIVQKEPEVGALDLPVFMLTHSAREKQINAVIRGLESLDVIRGPVTRIRVEYLDSNT